MNSLIKSFWQKILIITVEGVGRGKESKHTP